VRLEFLLPGQLLYFLVMAEAVEERTWKWGWTPLYLETCSTFLSMAEAVEERTWKWDRNPLYLDSCSTFLSMAEAVEERT
jgi:hypothetical protein